MIDSAMFLDFLVLALSGFALSLGKRGIWLYKDLIFSRGQWLAIHNWTSAILIILLLIHLILNWKWIKCMIGNIFMKRRGN